MSKNILIVYYSQSGQLKSIAENFIAPFQSKDYEIEWLQIKLKNDFPFPWSGKAFLRTKKTLMLMLAR